MAGVRVGRRPALHPNTLAQTDPEARWPTEHRSPWIVPAVPSKRTLGLNLALRAENTAQGLRDKDERIAQLKRDATWRAEYARQCENLEVGRPATMPRGAYTLPRNHGVSVAKPP